MTFLNIFTHLFGLNKLGKVDKVFFLALIIIVGVCVGIYFLIPVINHKQYQQQRDNLKKREEIFRQNLRSTSQPNITIENNEPADESSDVCEVKENE